ncbi:hypothetical protein I79_008302 [Cricetulus griseus]|uniref:Uncharacterized protein n=1 Tax=Cricetulus griseus TaxID=10029 RepID=G3HCT6_CRIGR|nr:hypothetical protein I79_008302 [Cricetulus griseus]
MFTDAFRGQKRESITQTEVELQAVVSYLPGVLGTKFWLSERQLSHSYLKFYL